MDIGFSKALPLFRQYGVRKAAVFGSFARRQASKKSDIDIIVSFSGRYDLLDLVGLKQDLEEACKRPVDLITYDSLKDDAFAKAVLKEAKVIYEQN